MRDIKVLGSGCRNCLTTRDRIAARAEALGVDITLGKVEDLTEIMRYGVMSTPGVVVDGTVVHAGGVPSSDAIDRWLR